MVDKRTCINVAITSRKRIDASDNKSFHCQRANNSCGVYDHESVAHFSDSYGSAYSKPPSPAGDLDTDCSEPGHHSSNFSNL